MIAINEDLILLNKSNNNQKCLRRSYSNNIEMIKGVKENKINAFLRIIGALFLLIGLLIAYNTANTQLLTQISINFYAIAAILAIIGIIAIVAEYRN